MKSHEVLGRLKHLLSLVVKFCRSACVPTPIDSREPLARKGASKNSQLWDGMTHITVGGN